jgi:hypothetical protein
MPMTAISVAILRLVDDDPMFDRKSGMTPGFHQKSQKGHYLGTN